MASIVSTRIVLTRKSLEFKMSQLTVYLDVGNEDGPAFFYTLKPFTGPKFPKIQMAGITPRPAIMPGEDETFIETPLLEVIHSGSIRELIEVHDWYDYFQSSTTIDQKEFTLNHVPPIPSSEILEQLIVILPYSMDPAKYILPLSVGIPNLSVLGEDMRRSEKQQLIDQLRPYRCWNSLYDIFMNRKIRRIDHAVLDMDSDNQSPESWVHF